jgi:hypothetical protein
MVLRELCFEHLRIHFDSSQENSFAGWRPFLGLVLARTAYLTQEERILRQAQDERVLR